MVNWSIKDMHTQQELTKGAGINLSISQSWTYNDKKDRSCDREAS